MKNTFKYLIGLIVVIALRLVPHPPNVEPIMSTMMPFSKKWGWASGMLFAILSVFLYDLATHTFGSWSIITAATYGGLGILAGLFLKNRENKIVYYVVFAIVATLIYDAITGIGMGVFLFHMPFMMTLTGQIPFTLNHLAGNIVLSAIISPALYRWVIANPALETRPVLSRLGLVGKRTSSSIN